MADPSEALRVRWIDLNPNGNIITINHPVKGHYPRRIQVSGTLVSMLNALPKTSENVFPASYPTMSASYINVRRKVATKLNNPRVLKITNNIQTLGRNHALPSDKRHPAGQEALGTQENREHDEVHSACRFQR